MDTTKKLEDAEIMQNLLKELRYTANSMSKELELSPMAIYLVLNGKNKITQNLVDRITKRFPNVHYWYLMKGQLPILLENPKLIQNQANLFNTALPNDGVDYSLESFITLKNIEKAINVQNELTKELIELLKQKKADH